MSQRKTPLPASCIAPALSMPSRYAHAHLESRREELEAFKGKGALGRALLALLLCFTCIPAQSLAFAKQAWAEADATFYIAYYSIEGDDGYMMSLESVENKGDTPENDPGKLVKTCEYSSPSTNFGDPLLNQVVHSVVARDFIEPNTVGGWFEGMRNLKTADLGKVSLRSVSSLRDLFKDCSSLESVNLRWSTAEQIVDMSEMFSGCSSLTSIDLSSYTWSSNTNLLRVSNWPAGTHYAAGMNLTEMFKNCSNLQSVVLFDRVITSGSLRFDGICRGCTNLQSFSGASIGGVLDAVGTHHTPTVTTTDCFAECPNLRTLKNVSSDMMPTVSSADIPGATGKWIKEGDSYVPEIVQNDIMPSWISNIPDVVYTGSPIEPAFRVVDNGIELVCGKDYAVEYKNNVRPGTATIVVSGRGKYTGSATKTFTIVSNSTANQGGSSSDSNQPNNPNSTGSNQNSTKPSTKAPADSDVTISSGTTGDSGAVAGSRPKIEIVIDGVTLREGIDFTVTYRNADKVGIATAIIKGTGKYSWTKTVSFAVKPKGTTFKKATLSKKKTTISWKKQASQTSGYQIRYATKESMKGAKTLKIANAKKTSTKLPRLKTGKSLYAQIRTYAVVNGKTYYSSWSAVQQFSNPPATTLSKVKATKKGFKAAWKKQSKAWTSGYQMRWSTAKSMKGAKKAIVKNAKCTSLKVSKLKGGKKYYVQVRSFKKVGKKTYYSPWSKAKAVKTKK